MPQRTAGDQPVAVWDPQAIIENDVDFLKETMADDWSEDQLIEDGYKDEDGEWNDEKLWEEASRRFDDFGSEYYQEFLDDLTTVIGEVNPDQVPWYGEGSNMGWRNASGAGQFNFTTGSEMVEQAMPKTNDFTMYVYKEDEGLRVTFSHHDSPTGEGYFFTPFTVELFVQENREQIASEYNEYYAATVGATIQWDDAAFKALEETIKNADLFGDIVDANNPVGEMWDYIASDGLQGILFPELDKAKASWETVYSVYPGQPAVLVEDYEVNVGAVDDAGHYSSQNVVVPSGSEVEVVRFNEDQEYEPYAVVRFTGTAVGADGSDVSIRQETIEVDPGDLAAKKGE